MEREKTLKGELVGAKIKDSDQPNLASGVRAYGAQLWQYSGRAEIRDCWYWSNIVWPVSQASNVDKRIVRYSHGDVDPRLLERFKYAEIYHRQHHDEEAAGWGITDRIRR